MTTNKTTFTITSAMSLNLEQLQALPTEALKEAMDTLKASPQKKAGRKADLIAGILKGRKSAEAEAEPEESEQLELVPVENSAKPKTKTPKMKMTSKTPKKKKAEPEAEAEQDAPEETPEPEKKPAKKSPKTKGKKADAGTDAEPEKKAPKSLKRAKKKKPNLDEMTPEELKAHIQSLEEQYETFPQEIAGQKTKYTKLENFETIKDLQRYIIENPLRLHVFADEKIDNELTQFLVLFANEDVLVLLDRNRERDTTMTVPQKNFSADTITFDKQKYEYSFYTRQ